MKGVFNMNQRGLSLVEVLIASAFMSGLAVMMSTLIDNGNRATKNVEQRNALAALQSALQTYLSSPDICKNSLVSGIKVPSNVNQPIELAVNIPGVGAVHSGSVLNTFGLGVSSLKLNSIQLATTFPDGSKSYFGVLELNATKLQSSVGGNAFKTREIMGLSIIADSSRNIVACGGTPSSGGGGGGGNTSIQPPPGLPPGTNASWETVVRAVASPTCDLSCVVQSFFQRNNLTNGFANTTLAANNWMANTPNWTSYAVQYSQSVAPTGTQLGYNTQSVDQWYLSSLNRNGLQGTQNIVNGVNVAQQIYGNSAVSQAISKNSNWETTASGFGVAQQAYGNSATVSYSQQNKAGAVTAATGFGAAASTLGADAVVSYTKQNPAAGLALAQSIGSSMNSGVSAAQASNLAATAASKYTPDQISSYLNTPGNSLATAQKAGLL